MNAKSADDLGSDFGRISPFIPDEHVDLRFLHGKSLLADRGVGLVLCAQEFAGHLLFVHQEVNRRVKEGQALQTIDQEAARIVKERYQEWGNDRWIPFEIRSLYAELTGTPLRLPDLFSFRNQ